MSTDNVVISLGPGDVLKSLSANFTGLRTSLSELVMLQNLEAIKSGTQNDLRDVLDYGASAFSTLGVVDVSLSQGVIEYFAILKSILPSVRVSDLSLELGPLAQSYSNEARPNISENKDILLDLSDSVKSLRIPINAVCSGLATLYSRIEGHDAELAHTDICGAFWVALNDLFRLSSVPLDSHVQIATLLEVTLGTLVGTFEAIFTDYNRERMVLNALKNLQSFVSRLQNLLVTLIQNVGGVVDDSISLLTFWDSIATRTANVKDLNRPATSLETNLIVKDWENAANLAISFIRTVGETPYNPTGQPLESTGPFMLRAKIPQNTFEIELQRFALSVKESMESPKIDSSTQGTGEDEKVVEKVLGPPAYTKKQLDELSTSTGRIISEYDGLLKEPFVKELNCTDPNTGGITNAFNLIADFRKRFVALQLDTIPVAKDLAYYSSLQFQLLPYVTIKPSPNPANTTLETFVKNNKALCNGYKAKAAELSTRSTKLKDDWSNVINVVTKSVNETNQKIKGLRQTIEDLKKKKKDRSFWDVISDSIADIFADVTFAPAVGILSSIGVLGKLGKQSVLKMSEEDLQEGIDKLWEAISMAQLVRTKLYNLIYYMGIIADSISMFSSFWSDLATSMSKLDAFFGVIDGPAGATLFKTLRPGLIVQWKDVYKAVDKYLLSLGI